MIHCNHTISHRILTHLNAQSDVTIDNWAYVDTANLTQNDSHNDDLEFGTLYAEHSV
jgi:hypothetical protein